ncbi:hypothetical protein CW740_08845 [Kangiella profundi]|uniref:Uncharacterized protein n=1 Tax=Kangiella profundi TaxID=1561924 RepID=A0A2K9AG14_9GAMM|nr:hypothetical protein [Kangiella profundi]AUD79346.1 hypothetical protein CW740_08845 [Kangiella profundi]GGE99375.1 hypothetical protein GCM10011356_11370 [Kangiella profundi]
MNWILSFIILLTGHFLIGFCFVSFIKPEATKHFLRQFASSAKAHYIEQLIRIVIGISLVLNASQMQLMNFHLVLGWLIVITSLGLLGIPWRWHKKFADKVNPWVIRLLPLYAIGCLMLGSILIYGVLG